MEDFSFDNFEELYNYIITQNDSIPKLPLYINDLFKKYKLVPPLSQEDETYLLHFKLELEHNDVPEYKNIKLKLIKEIDSLINTDTPIKTKVTKISERTDKHIITNVHCLDESVDLMKLLVKDEELANKHNSITFDNPKCKIANKSLKTDNLFGLDKLGIVIRRGCFMTKSKAFAWKYLEGTRIPVSYFYESILPDEDNIKKILAHQYQIQPTAFTKPGGVIYKIYSQDEELLKRYENFMKEKTN